MITIPDTERFYAFLQGVSATELNNIETRAKQTLRQGLVPDDQQQDLKELLREIKRIKTSPVLYQKFKICK